MSSLVKQPWEMTRREWREYASSLSMPGRRMSTIYEDDQFHEDWIRARLREGKPVPTKVIAEYPELKTETNAV